MDLTGVLFGHVAGSGDEDEDNDPTSSFLDADARENLGGLATLLAMGQDEQDSEVGKLLQEEKEERNKNINQGEQGDKEEEEEVSPKFPGASLVSFHPPLK